MHAERSSSGQRQYSDTAVDQVLLIQQLYAAGLSSMRQSPIELVHRQHLDSVTSAVPADVSTGAVCGRETRASRVGHTTPIPPAVQTGRSE
ncbi:hypothetical protein ACWFPY_34525 [Nocardia fluminea]